MIEAPDLPASRAARGRSCFKVACCRKTAHKGAMGKDYLPSLKTRVSLLERLRDWKDQASWEDFFDTYWKLIYSTACKAGLSEDEAQDVVQKTMYSVSRRMPTFRYDATRGSFKGWLLKLTRWRIVDQFRERPPAYVGDGLGSGNGTSTESIMDIPGPAALVPDNVWETDWMRNLAEVALARVRTRVDPQNYQLFEFHVNKEWPVKKVAERFGVRPAHVHLVKHRVTALLKEEIERLEKDTF